jgi:predicted nucleotidyltransferase
VRREEAGRAHLYSLNREHLAAPHICALAELRGELIDRLRSEIGAWTISPPVAVLFGSTARDEARERSDLDLLVVRPDGVAADDPRWRDQLERLAGQAHAWTGNEAEILEWEERDLPRVLGREPVLAAAAREGVALAGSVQRLRAAARRTRSRAAG